MSNKKIRLQKNYLGKNIVLDRLIVMDDVSGLADRSEAFANFLTFLENMDCHAFIFFIRLIQSERTGK